MLRDKKKRTQGYSAVLFDDEDDDDFAEETQHTERNDKRTTAIVKTSTKRSAALKEQKSFRRRKDIDYDDIDDDDFFDIEEASKSYKNKGVSSRQRSSDKKRHTGFILVVLILAGVGGFFGFRFIRQKQHDERVTAIAYSANDISSEVASVLTATAPSTWVYDRDENLILTLKLSQAVEATGSVPVKLQQTILEDCNNDVAGNILDEFFIKKGIVPDDETFEGYYLRLTSNYTQDKLLSYKAAIETYGGIYTGLSAASTNYFGVSPSELNEQQVEFICATYKNADIDLETYYNEHSITEERLGLIVHRSDYAAIRAKVIEELSLIPGVDINNHSYYVKLTTSSQQQSILQSIINTEMRQLIDLNADGTYALNCSVAVADRGTGFIRAFITGRSSTQASALFEMNTLNFVSNFDSLSQLLKNKTVFGFALQQVELSNGDKEYRSIRELFNSQTLATGGTVETLDAINLMRELFAQSSTFNGVNLVYQVNDENNNVVYKAAGTTVLSFDNNNLSHFLSEETGGSQTEIALNFDISTGVISFRSTADYVAVILVGSGAIGGSVTQEQMNVLHSTVESLRTSISSFYPTPYRPLWDSLEMTENMQACYTANQGYISDLFTVMLQDFSAMEIVSKQTRTEWETKYEEISKFIDKYQEFVGQTYAESLRKTLQDLRIERTELLVQYST